MNRITKHGYDQESLKTRRALLAAMSVAGAGALLIGCCRTSPNQAGSITNDEPRDVSGPAEVTANEDLMREHGVLRQALIVYRETAARLKQDPASVSPEALEKTALLFRVFGEDYHEKKLGRCTFCRLLRSFAGRQQVMSTCFWRSMRAGARSRITFCR